MSESTEITRLMLGATTNLGSVGGYFACIPRLQSVAASGYCASPQLALAELEINIKRHLEVILDQEKREDAAK